MNYSGLLQVRIKKRALTDQVGEDRQGNSEP
jgi:hypothetical protein